ncbi:hypothetical protein JCM10213_000008 [Rhodosporidiobolus nylandii]
MQRAVQVDTGENDHRGSGFRPRQSSYLRISPTSVLQMILYLEPAHTEWMNNDVLERMLYALKDRIPLKLAQEGTGKRTGKEKTQVDVFRGADYQMAFFFRRAYDKHVVMLKDKHLHYATRPSQPQPHPAPPPRKRPRSRSPSSSASPAPPAKRTATAGEDDEIIVVKPEPDADELPPGSLFRAAAAEEEEEQGAGFGERGEETMEEVKEEVDEDVKPVLKVNYQGYRIFGRTLVVIVEPYPPLPASDLARPRLLQQEIRQLSASVAPEAYKSGASFRASTLSATPAPRRGAARPLFRTESATPALGETPVPEEDGQLRRLREETEALAQGFGSDDDEDGQGDAGQGEGEGENELPSLDKVMGKGKGKEKEKERAVEEGEETEGQNV